MDICSFWYEGKLRSVDRICLASMVLATHNSNDIVKLYSYGKIEDVPEGVVLCDANEILDKGLLQRINPYYPLMSAVSLAQFSDLFRIMLMKQQKGLWLDTDLYLYEHFSPLLDKIWLARENFYRLGVSVMYIPANNPIISEYENYLESKAILPKWLGFKRRYIKPLFLKIKKQPIIAPKIGITIFGNDGISRLAKKYGLFSQAQAKNTFYFWTGSKSANIYNSSYGLAPLYDKVFKGFHIHRKELSSKIPTPNCFYDWAVKRVAKFYNVTIESFFK